MYDSFELGGEKKTKGAALTFVSLISLAALGVLNAPGINTVNVHAVALCWPWASLLFFLIVYSIHT